MSLRVIVVVLALATVACGSVDPDRVAVSLRLPTAPECQPASLGSMSLTALGDFATSDATVEVLPVGGAPSELSGFPRSSLALAARATTSGWDGFGWARVEDLRSVPELLVLPLGRSCAIADPEARLPVGAALAVLSASSVFVAGGLDERGSATRRLAILEARTERVELPSPTLLNPTAFASATMTPDGHAILIAGGASSADGEVRDTWERISFDDSERAYGTLRTPRRDHGSIAIARGALRGVLLVGGSDGSAALDTIEWIDPDAGTTRTLSAHLTEARRSPRMVALDETTIAIFAGETMAGAPVPGIDLLDLDAEAIARASIDPGPADWAVALADGRIAVSVDETVQIVLRGGAVLAEAGSSPSIVSPVAVALASGRILVAGRDARGDRLATLFDPSTGSSEVTSVSPVPTALVALPDGTTLALDEAGASIRRDDRMTPFDSPRPLFLFATDRGDLALDAASRWHVDGDELVALEDDARIDVPVLRLRELGLELSATGAVAIALVDPFGAEAATIRIDETSVGLGGCVVARTTSSAARIVRRGATIELVADGASASCTAEALPERVGVAVVAARGARLRSLALVRLP